MIKYRLLGGILFILISGFVTSTSAETYYVDAKNGKDSNPGLTIDKPWKTISKINRIALKGGFKSSDIICLKRGSVWSNDECLGHPVNKGNGKAWIQWGPINGLTIKDYGTGEKPRLDGNTQRPVYIRSSLLENLIIQNIDISGQDWSNEKGSNLSIVDVNGVTLDGIEGDGYRGSQRNAGKTAITVSKCKHRIEIKNCRLSNWGKKPILTRGKDFMGISVIFIEKASILIHDNQVSNTIDALHYFKNKGQGKIYNNTLFNGAENSIDCKSSSNVEIFNNRMYRDKTFTGSGGTGGGSLLGIHDNAGFISGTSGILIHHNNFGPSDKNYINVKDLDEVEIYRNIFVNPERGISGTGITLKRTKDTKIHHNRLSDIYGNINIKNHVENLVIHHNIILNPNKVPVKGGFDRGGIFEQNLAEPPTRIYNNIIYNGNGTIESLVTIVQSRGTAIINNIGFQNMADKNGVVLWIGKTKKRLIISNNCWFAPGNGAIVVNRGHSYRQIHQQIWTRSHPGDLFADPLFVSAKAGDLRLQPESPCIDKAQKLGSMYQLAFDPENLDIDADQALFGKGWDMGAYCFIPKK